MNQLPAARISGDAGLVVHIRALSAAELPTAVRLFSGGMANNPLHMAAFGTQPKRRQHRLQRFFVPLLRHVYTNGHLLGAFVDGQMIGVLGMFEPGCCRPSGMQTLGLIGAIVGSNTPVGAWRIGRWLDAWRRHDPPEAHWHLGPLVVSATYRRRGVARQLMQHVCQCLDQRSGNAWLETDLAANVAFYASLGFVVTACEPVLGVPNWFMRRTVQPLAPASSG
ncbi:MAG: GNAT family N-acetyltransferase [Rhodanobacter sp.]